MRKRTFYIEYANYISEEHVKRDFSFSMQRTSKSYIDKLFNTYLRYSRKKV